ncbi:MAG: PEP-CTERM sorting domain-containing protein [Terrimicrobiaceae bacterium]
MKRLTLSVAIALAGGICAHAQIASDVASNYGGSWTNNSTGGTGFLPWSITNNDGGAVFAGTFTGNSTAGAGNINTSDVSFGLFANPVAASVTASRAFSLALTTGDVFTFQLALNFDNGNKGFNIFAGTQGEVFNFNVGTGGSVSSANAVLNPGSGLGYNYGGNDAVINVSLSVTSSTQFAYNISRTSSLGNQGTLFSGNVTGLTQALSGFAFYNSGTDNGAAQNNLYVNTLSVIPEPSTYALVALGLAGLVIFSRRRAS